MKEKQLSASGTHALRPMRVLEVRALEPTDVPIFCSWISTPEALSLVSGDVGERLTPGILEKWTQDATGLVVVGDSAARSPLAFCTLSVVEHPHLPQGHAELCHLIVDPKENYFAAGSVACREAARLARSLGFATLVGRVVPRNAFARRLALRAGFLNCTHDNWSLPGFLWYRLELHALWWES